VKYQALDRQREREDARSLPKNLRDENVTHAVKDLPAQTMP